MNGVSKKLCIAAISISAICKLGEDAPNKLPYAIGVVVICVVYKFVQGWIDKNGKN